MLQIFYGSDTIKKNVTTICYQKLLVKNMIIIPSTDQKRAFYFSDPHEGILKKIYIMINDYYFIYDDSVIIKINLDNKSVSSSTIDDISIEINKIHSKLKLDYGSFLEELPEQKMVLNYLKGNEKVLELGSNIGRNSLIIGHILGENNKNFVTVECNKNIFKQLEHNRNINNMNFHIENSAISKRKLIQQIDSWITKISDSVPEGYEEINIITFEELQKKYNIEFDTLIIDCEGSFYYILMDMPDILKNINLIIMENDYWDISHKNYIDNILKQNNFYVEYSESGGWGPCYNNFYEVWKK
jgi:FkbM family methyltransferase